MKHWILGLAALAAATLPADLDGRGDDKAASLGSEAGGRGG